MPQNKNHRLQGQELAIIGHVKIKTTTHKSYPTSAFSTYRWSSILQIPILALYNLSSIPYPADTHLNLYPSRTSVKKKKHDHRQIHVLKVTGSLLYLNPAISHATNKSRTPEKLFLALNISLQNSSQ